MRLDEARAVVTGAAGSLAPTVMETLIAGGAAVVGVDISEPAVARAEQVRVVVGDLSIADDADRAITSAAADLGGLNVLVALAGMISSAPLVSVGPNGLDMHPEALWDQTIRSNLYSTFFAGRAAASIMIRARTQGVLVLFSSVVAPGNAGQSAYAAAKAATESLVATWAAELGPWGIRVVGVAPGFVDVPSTEAALGEESLGSVRSRTPLRRLGDPSDIGAAVRYAVESDFTSGTVLRVDGGLRL